jgi:hypothetical protein
MPEEYAPDGAAEFLDAWLPPKTGFADRVPAHLETIRRAKELADKGDYYGVVDLLEPVRLDYRLAGVKLPSAVRDIVSKAYTEENKRLDAKRDERTSEVHKLNCEIDDLSIQAIYLVRRVIPRVQHLLDVLREAAEEDGKPLPSGYQELKERVEVLEANTAPGAEMLKDLEKACEYAKQEHRYLYHLVESIDPKYFDDEEDV